MWRHFHETSEELYGTFSRRLLTLRRAGAGRCGARHLRSKRFSPKGRLLRIYLFSITNKIIFNNKVMWNMFIQYLVLGFEPIPSWTRVSLRDHCSRAKCLHYCLPNKISHGNRLGIQTHVPDESGLEDLTTKLQGWSQQEALIKVFLIPKFKLKTL